MLKAAFKADGSTQQVHLNWRKQSFDARDEEYKVKIPVGLAGLPTAVDNRNICSQIENQGNLGSCTANMFAGMIESNELRQAASKKTVAILKPAATTTTVTVSNVVTDSAGVVTFQTMVTPPVAPTPGPNPPPPNPPGPTPRKLIEVSRLFEYYATRKIEGTVNEDTGATIRDTIKAGAAYGVADEALWPYDVSKFAVNPPQNVWTAAASHKVTSYHAVTDGDIQTMKAVLASGYLVGFGFLVYSYFLSADMAKRGFLNLPGPTEYFEGGHAVALVGYDDSKNAFLVRNSWGTSWGLTGYFWMVYPYVQNTRLSSDFWVIQSSPI